MTNKDKIFLIGPMGAGKSTIGRLLAELLDFPFIDSDKDIEERAGANIPWIFDVEGEEGFRERESKSIDILTQQSPIVLATGGGVVGRAFNRDCLCQRGTVVYLQTSVDTQLERTAKDKNRPLLQSEDPRKVLTELLAKRGPYYESMADIVADTNELTPKGVVELILRELSYQYENA